MPRLPALSSAGSPWAPVAIGTAAALVVFLLLRVLVFDNGGEVAQGRPSSGPMAQMCLHLNEFQVQRVGALRRGADLLVGDAAALRAAGDARTARKVDRLVIAARAFADALDSSDPDDDASGLNKMSRARSAMPC